MDPEAKVNKLTAVGFYLLKDLLLQLTFLQSDAIIPKGEEIANFSAKSDFGFLKKLSVFCPEGYNTKIRNEGVSPQKCA